jgi:protoporphyrinogen oxidase
MTKQPTITIIGAGVSGLAAALTLQNQGYSFQILEASSEHGGRVQTDYQGGLILDRGFQVLLDAYPAAQEFLDFDQLNLVRFAPASMVFEEGKSSTVGDPTRDASFLWKTITASVGTVQDKLLVFRLSRKLKKKSLKSIFEAPELTTQQYLENAGFSEKMINQFFRPFYAGIFLEDQLQTSSRIFEFVFKMFSVGHATLPAAGIAAIPNQMVSRLQDDSIKYNTPVERVVNKEITLKNGDQLTSDYTIIATQADQLIPNLPLSNLPWHQVTTLYFTTDHEGFGKPIIGLISAKDSLTNNFHFLHDVFSEHEKLISISIVKDHDMKDADLEHMVRDELQQHAKVTVDRLISIQHIRKALPALGSINYSMDPTETQLTAHVYLAGDHLSNGSLNAAMLNGKAAAQAVIDKIEGKIIVG